MANIGTFSMKIWREMEKEAKVRRQLWIDQEKAYDRDHGVHEGKRLWPSRTYEQLESDYERFVRDGHWADIKAKHQAWAQPKMEFMWEMQANFVKAKQTVAERLGLDHKQNYFITIRPDESRTTFDDFYKLVHKFVNRACFLTYTMAFEQKGKDEQSLGKGFHVHIVAHMKQRSKGEVLRDTINSFKTVANDNCIDVQIAPRPAGIIDKYLKGISDDGHKEETHAFDSQWRIASGLQELYDDNHPLPATRNQPIKSNRLVTFSIAEVTDAS